MLGRERQARFHTKSGLLTADRRGDWIELDFPATREEKSEAPAALLESLDIKSPRYVGKNKFDYIIEVASEDEVRRINPNHAMLRTLPVRGVIVTSDLLDLLNVLGRLIALKGPGLFFIIPFGVDRLVKIDLRTITLEVPPQEIITNDNVTAKVNAVIYFQVVDARRAGERGTWS